MTDNVKQILTPKLKKILLRTSLCVAILFFIPLCFFCLVYWGAFGKIYTGKELKSLQNYLASEVYSADKQLIGSYYWENRSNISSKHLPSYIVNALIATEDARFYEHNGVDTRGLMRVFFKTLLLREKNSGGGSTIAQQLAKNLLHREDHGMLSMPVNKIKEAIHAVRFNKVYLQQEILALYLNTVSVGEDTYGFENASVRFFNRRADSLRIEEAAVLVGMLKSPTRYNPRTHPELALGRRNVVIDNMHLHGYLSLTVADSLKKLPLLLHYFRKGPAGVVAPYFVSHIEPIVTGLLDSLRNPEGKPYNLYTDGLKIYTTLDSRLQLYAMKAVKMHMQMLQEQFEKYWAHAEPWGRDNTLITRGIKNSKRFKSLLAQGMNEAEILRAFKTPQETELFDWKGGHTSFCSAMDSVKYTEKILQAAFMAMNPNTGEVKVYIGGDDYYYSEYDHINARRQVGSTFKPIVYATALEQGMSPCDYVKNEQKVYEQFGGWSPSNADGKYGGKYSLKGALAHSVNVVSVEVLLRAGISNTIRMAHKMGITDAIPAVPSIALGVADLSLLEMVRAYCDFPNGGVTKAEVCITRIEDKNGKVIYSAGRNIGSRAFSPETAYFMDRMLRGVIDEGTAHGLRDTYHLEGQIAGKTGTTQNEADGWFIGFTPDLVAGAWVGAESPEVHFTNLTLGQGAHMALPIWGLFFQQCKNDKHYKQLLTGIFKPGAGSEAFPDCPSFVEDTILGKIRNWFKRGRRKMKDGKTNRKTNE